MPMPIIEGTIGDNNIGDIGRYIVVTFLVPVLMWFMGSYG